MGKKGHLKDEVRAGDRLSEGELVLPAQWVEQWVGPPLCIFYIFILQMAGMLEIHLIVARKKG